MDERGKVCGVFSPAPGCCIIGSMQNEARLSPFHKFRADEESLFSIFQVLKNLTVDCQVFCKRTDG